MDGAEITDTIMVPSTGGWQNWVTVSYPGVELTQGEHLLKLVMEGSEFNLNWIKFLKE
jgi:endoglucanase